MVVPPTVRNGAGTKMLSPASKTKKNAPKTETANSDIRQRRASTTSPTEITRNSDASQLPSVGSILSSPMKLPSGRSIDRSSHRQLEEKHKSEPNLHEEIVTTPRGSATRRKIVPATINLLPSLVLSGLPELGSSHNVIFAPIARRSASQPAHCSSTAIPAAAVTPSAKTPSKEKVVARRFMVQPNAYHSSFILNMLTSWGPEWKPHLKQVERPASQDIIASDFVWFKFEYFKSFPLISRSVVPLELLNNAALRQQFALRVVSEAAEDPRYDSFANMKRDRLLPLDQLRESMTPRMNVAALSSEEREVGKKVHYQLMSFPDPYSVIACFQDASGLWRKHSLYVTLKSYCDAQPSLRGSIRERMPLSFPFNSRDSSHPEEAVKWMKYVLREGFAKKFVVKATGSANGNGFIVSSNPEEIIKYIAETKPTYDASWWIIQEFLENMPLIGPKNNRRFHMKIHVVMVATPIGIDLYAYTLQRLTLCMLPFSWEEMHPCSYIGNWGQQRHVNGVQDPSMKYCLMFDEAKKEYHQLPLVWERAKEIVVEAVEAAWLHNREHFRFVPGCYELMGWDFIVEEAADGAWRPLLLETNHRPGYGGAKAYMEKLIRATACLVSFPVFHKRNQRLAGEWAEVEHLWEHIKTIVISHQVQPLPTSFALDAAAPIQEKQIHITEENGIANKSSEKVAVKSDEQQPTSDCASPFSQ